MEFWGYKRKDGRAGIRKGGTRPIVEVLAQAERPTKRGAIVMDTAGYDISSVTSMVAAGCNVIVFTTYSWMEDNMDVDLSGILRGEESISASGERLLTRIHEVANGRLTKAEAYGFSDIAVDHVCRFV